MGCCAPRGVIMGDSQYCGNVMLCVPGQINAFLDWKLKVMGKKKNIMEIENGIFFSFFFPSQLFYYKECENIEWLLMEIENWEHTSLDN